MNYSFALQLLIDLAQREIESLEINHKLLEQNPVVAPAPVRKAAKRRADLLEAVKIIKGATNGQQQTKPDAPA